MRSCIAALCILTMVSCKDKPDPVSFRGPALNAFLQTQEAACLNIKGAEWSPEQQLCVKPYSLEMCRKADKSLVWDGMECVAQSKQKNFYRLCIDLSTSDAVKQTVRKITDMFQGSSCQDVNTALEEKETFTMQGEMLVDLTPFQGLEHLRHLDLWNNRIIDISPLRNLKGLETLTLGHNEIIDVGPLASLTQLQELYLFENSIYDVSPLANLTSLKILDLRNNRIQDFSPVEALGLKNLSKEGNLNPIDLLDQP